MTCLTRCRAWCVVPAPSSSEQEVLTPRRLLRVAAPTPACFRVRQDTEEALRRLPQEEVDLRMQRLKRAMDLSMKHVYLPKDMQEKQTPFNFYLQDTLDQVKAERAERASLGTGQPYNRQIP